MTPGGNKGERRGRTLEGDRGTVLSVGPSIRGIVDEKSEEDGGNT